MRKLFAVAAVAGGLVVAAVLVFVVYLGSIGGLSGSYRARDGDILLTQIARTARPVIDALSRFRNTQQRYPNPDSDQDLALINASLPAGLKAARIRPWLIFNIRGGPGWQYTADASNPRSYTLSIKLGWDPRLAYIVSETGAQWVFVPGDGREEKVVVLHP